jgi:hypothetical protein
MRKMLQGREMKGEKAVLIYIAIAIIVILAAGYVTFDRMREAGQER